MADRARAEVESLGNSVSSLFPDFCLLLSPFYCNQLFTFKLPSCREKHLPDTRCQAEESRRPLDVLVAKWHQVLDLSSANSVLEFWLRNNSEPRLKLQEKVYLESHRDRRSEP